MAEVVFFLREAMFLPSFVIYGRRQDEGNSSCPRAPGVPYTGFRTGSGYSMISMSSSNFEGRDTSDTRFGSE